MWEQVEIVLVLVTFDLGCTFAIKTQRTATQIWEIFGVVSVFDMCGMQGI